ncbi:unnamed protein product [Paramecium sonneborni]|uniref:Transmembrane protein n=1 Tax=Paramecium sonneborni TaxID=65129 RepID=A0A8S1REL2_9CILI|nr:unnamed protein product [Paramecium sonneborni]
MIFFTFILAIKCCPLMIDDANQNINIYPTNGEYFEYPISDLFEGNNLIYNYYPIIPNIQLKNAFTKISQIDGYEFQSISSNQTHFATITKENYVILYEWNNFNIQQYGQRLSIKKEYQCYNIIMIADINILLDCYAEDHFYLLNLMNTSFNIVYSIQTKKPISSKMQAIYNESELFLIYAQYYQNLSVLTLFSSQYDNLTSYQNEFIQIDIPQRENPYIYILFGQSISQFIITQNYTFYETSNFMLKRAAQYFQVYYDYQILSQCDQLIILSYDVQDQYEASRILGCVDGIINYIGGGSYDLYQSKQLIQVVFNDELVLFQSLHYLKLYTLQENEYSLGYVVINKDTQIYFNLNNNILFTFSKQIIVYQLLAIPTLQINLTEQQVQGNKYDITIQMKYLNLTQKGLCKLFMSITILDQNDLNIYLQRVLSNQVNFPMYELTNSKKDIQFFGEFSGQLLSYNVYTNNKQFGSLNQKTFQKQFEFTNQTFYLAQIVNIQFRLFPYNTFFIGITNEQIQIFLIGNSLQSYDLWKAFNISIKPQALQVAYSISEILIIGLKDNDKIYLYQIYCNQIEPSSYKFQFRKFEEQFSFLVTFNNLITLFERKEIQITTLNFTDLVIINEIMINQLFNRDKLLKFNPIQIAINTQSLSSCLFINNINNVIIIAIGQHNQPIPVSIIEFKFQIKQINIVNQQLVLSYICNSKSDVCFQVWNFQNLRQPFFMKDMKSVLYKNLLTILSDNLFFYVQLSNYTVLVYNPYIPEHMSLYYQLNLSSTFICTFYLNYQSYQSLLYFDNSIYSLFAKQNFELQVNQSLNFERSYPVMIYNYSVTSLLNQTAIQYTPNQSLIYASNFTMFQPKTKKNIILEKKDLNLNDRTFTIPMNLILDRQTSLCYFPNSSQNDQQDQYFSNHTCNISNFGYSSVNQNQKSYKLVTAVNNQFFVLQNNSYILIVNQQLEYLQLYNYTNFNFDECLKSTSFNLTLSSICQNASAQYLLSITFDLQGNVQDINSFLIPYTLIKITKINTIAYLNFILATSYNSSIQELYLFNQLNSSSMNSINNNYYIQDFSVALFNSSQDINKQNLVILTYISDDYIYYQYLYLRKNSFELASNSFFHQQTGVPVFGVQILILQIINNQILILITSREGISGLFVFQVFQGEVFDIIATIPNYNFGNISLIHNSIYSNGFLLQQFQLGYNYTIGVYQIGKFFDNTREDPILMIGSQNSTSLEYAFIGNTEHQNGTCLALHNDGSILNYSISTRLLQCHYRQRKTTVQVNILCENEFSSGSYEITFVLPPLEINSRGWIYSLIILITLQLIGFYFLVKYRMRNFGYINPEIEI